MAAPEGPGWVETALTARAARGSLGMLAATATILLTPEAGAAAVRAAAMAVTVVSEAPSEPVGPAGRQLVPTVKTVVVGQLITAAAAAAADSTATVRAPRASITPHRCPAGAAELAACPQASIMAAAVRVVTAPLSQATVRARMLRRSMAAMAAMVAPEITM